MPHRCPLTPHEVEWHRQKFLALAITIVYATADLDANSEWKGARDPASIGGPAPIWVLRNALVDWGKFLSRDHHARNRTIQLLRRIPFGLRPSVRRGLVGWAAKGSG